MRLLILIGAVIVLAGCQLPEVFKHEPAAASTSATPIHAEGPAAALNGEYDNHEQARHSGIVIPIAHIRHRVRLLDNASSGAWLEWTVQFPDASSPLSAVWLYRLAPAANGHAWTLMPYRPVTSTAVQNIAAKFDYRPDDWNALPACAQSGKWEKDTLSLHADSAACAPVLTGLGAAAALLPLRIELKGDMLQVVLLADQARGADAAELARHVRRFTGWAAINGGGMKAKATNADWHMRDDLALTSEGGRMPLRWRDGAVSGYSLELERLIYPERHLDVLQLNLIDEASGKIITYVWTDPASRSIGMNLGWLQIGLVQQANY